MENHRRTSFGRVAVTMRVDLCMKTHERRDSIDQRVLIWLSEVGACPILVPNTLDSIDKARMWLEQNRIESILLTGGNDLGSALERDSTELNLLTVAESLRLSVLGICRGMQIMARYFKVELTEADNHVGTRHKIYGTVQGEVNSYHKYCINKCPNEFSILATDNDGLIEAIRHNILPWEGWMWHPEREVSFRHSDVIRFRSLIFESNAK